MPALNINSKSFIFPRTHTSCPSHSWQFLFISRALITLSVPQASLQHPWKHNGSTDHCKYQTLNVQNRLTHWLPWLYGPVPPPCIFSLWGQERFPLKMAMPLTFWPMRHGHFSLPHHGSSQPTLVLHFHLATHFSLWMAPLIGRHRLH